MRHIHHVTLQTGHSLRSERSDVALDAIVGTAALLIGHRDDDRVPLPVEPAGCWMRVTWYGRCLLATVMHADDLPLVTFGVAGRPRCGATLWRRLLDVDERTYGTLHGDPAAQPQAPWCAARLEPGLPLMLDTTAWLADLERTAAWAWLDIVDGVYDCPRCGGTEPPVIDRGDVLCGRCGLVLP